MKNLSHASITGLYARPYAEVVGFHTPPLKLFPYQSIIVSAPAESSECAKEAAFRSSNIGGAAKNFWQQGTKEAVWQKVRL